MAAGDEARQGQLRQRGVVPVLQGAGDGHRRHQRRRQDHAADAQAGKQRLGERADVERPLVGVQALHAGGGPAGVVELAVVVVLDDPCLLPLRPFDQRQAALQRQGHAGRVMVRRGQAQRPRCLRLGEDRLGPQALFVDRDRQALQACGLEGLARAVVGRVLDEYPLAGVEQHAGAKTQRLLRTGQHQYPVGRGACATLQVDVVGDRLAQRFGTLRVAMGQARAPYSLRTWRCRRSQVARERCGSPARRERRGAGRAAREPRRQPASPRHAGSVAARRRPVVERPRRAGRGQPGSRGDHAAAADPTLDEALGMQVRIGRFDGVAGYPQRLRQRREAGNGLPGASAPSRISWRIARWIRACSGRAWSCGWRRRALTDSSSDCLNKWSALDYLIGGVWQAIRRL